MTELRLKNTPKMSWGEFDDCQSWVENQIAICSRKTGFSKPDAAFFIRLHFMFQSQVYYFVDEQSRTQAIACATNIINLNQSAEGASVGSSGNHPCDK